jgi:Ca2+-binding RTX toxin-like protein
MQVAGFSDMLVHEAAKVAYLYLGGRGRMDALKRILLLSASMALVLVLASGVALAVLGDVPDPDTAGANGRVSDILVSDDTVYLAGSFTRITDKDGTTFVRNNLAAIDAVSGAVTAWNPDARSSSGASSVRSMALSSDGLRLFVGGTFTSVGGQTRNRLAAVDPDTGQVDRNWRGTGVNSVVRSLAVSGNRLYLGGDFTTVKGEPRMHLAAVDTTTAALDPVWTPSATKPDGSKSDVYALDLSADGTRVYVGGLFNTISGIRTERLAAVDAVTGSVDPVFRPATPNHTFAMDVSGGNVYVGTGDPLEGMESFDGTTGQLRWRVPGGHPDPRAGDVQAITVWGDTVYAGGHGTLVNGLIRQRIFAADAATGAILPWAPEIPGGSGSLGVWALDHDPLRGFLYAGGDFTQVSGQPRERFVRFSEAPPQGEDCTIVGTPNNDVLEGTTGEDVICGGGGADTIRGLGGNDTLRGEGEPDKLLGGEGDDILDGGSSSTDTADFSGSLTPVSASLTNGAATGEGSDTLIGVESLTGSRFNDTLTGSDAGNTLSGGGGPDMLDGLVGPDKLFGAGDNDTLRGGSGNDALVGNAGADQLLGEGADDRLDSRDETVGNDSLDGGTHTKGDTCTTDATELSVANCEL